MQSTYIKLIQELKTSTDHKTNLERFIFDFMSQFLSLREIVFLYRVIINHMELCMHTNIN